jgi:RNA polymerase sigma-70 factor (ECF subfamily)
MIKWFLRKAINRFERDWNYDASYMRDMIDSSPRAAWLFSRVTALGQFRRDIPIEPWFAAGITAVRHEDCGPCTQLAVAMAERTGVSPAVLRAVLADDPEAMPPDVRLVWNFTRATLAHDASADEYREAIVERWGRRAVVSLAFAITAANLSHGQVRPWPRQGLHASRRWRYTGNVRSRPGAGAGGYGGAHAVSSAGATSNPATSFEPHRRRLLGLAYRILGSMADAEDAVQETILRWHAADRDKVSDPRAFLMTTTTRICLDMLTSARARREEYVGPWLPEPVLDTAALAPDSRTELAEDLSVALLLTLDRLSPLERAAFLLHEVFDFSFSEVATTLERSEGACQQLAARARAHVRAVRPRGTAPPPARSGEIDAKHAQLMSAFVAATRSGDLNALMQLLSSDVRVVTDGGSKVAAARNVLEGADRTARFLIGVTRKGWRENFTLRFATINGLPGVIVDGLEGPLQTTAFEIEGDVIRALYVVRNPDKLRHLGAASAPRESGPG